LSVILAAALPRVRSGQSRIIDHESQILTVWSLGFIDIDTTEAIRRRIRGVAHAMISFLTLLRLTP